MFTAQWKVHDEDRPQPTGILQQKLKNGFMFENIFIICSIYRITTTSTSRKYMTVFKRLWKAFSYKTWNKSLKLSLNCSRQKRFNLLLTCDQHRQIKLFVWSATSRCPSWYLSLMGSTKILLVSFQVPQNGQNCRTSITSYSTNNSSPRAYNTTHVHIRLLPFG